MDTVPANAPSLHHQHGLTLVEMLVALVLALVVVAGLGQLYVGGREVYRLTEISTQMNEDGRFGIDFLAEEIRMSGFYSCGGSSAFFATTVDSSTAWMFQPQGLMGYEGGVDTFPSEFASEVETGTDALVIRHAEIGDEQDVWVHSIATNRIFFQANPGFETGDIVVVEDGGCSQATVFQVTSTDQATNGSYFSIYHSPNTSQTPGNCTDLLAGAFNCGDTSGAFDMTYGTEAHVSRLIARAFYVANDTESTLTMRELTTDSSGNAIAEAYPLITGVETLQLLYGVDTAGTGTVTSYVTADQVTDWSDVYSIRIGILTRSSEDNLLAEDGPSTISVAGTTINVGSDKRIRKVFNVTVALRNNLP